ncbi:MAG: Crp/Fnr family transcriptional regulator [Chloroflexota bacterium]|nr:Crp/Fnr family transcriptional regulator [Chloroflexota bacterium]
MPAPIHARPPGQNHLLAQVPQGEYKQFLPYLEHVRLVHKEILTRPGDQISHVYFPTRGAISLITHVNHTRGVETATTGRDGCVGVSVVFEDTTCLQDWLVQVPGEAQRMTIIDFQRALQTSQSLRYLVGRYTIALLNQTARGSACNRRHPIEQRLARWLLVVHDLADGDELPLTQEFLALMLGVRRASVNQTAGVLQNAMLIDYRPGLITVLDRDRLERASCEDYRRSREEYERLLGQPSTQHADRTPPDRDPPSQR